MEKVTKKSCLETLIEKFKKNKVLIMLVVIPVAILVMYKTIKK